MIVFKYYLLCTIGVNFHVREIVNKKKKEKKKKKKLAAASMFSGLLQKS